MWLYAFCISQFFYRHELLKPYRYYWRVEPGVKFFCDMDYDPFIMMQEQKKVYGFTISLFEWQQTIPSLWNTVKEFIKEFPQHLAENNSMDFISNDGGDSYNLCHFWSNFEIADMNFWRGEAYQAFFDYLEKQGASIRIDGRNLLELTRKFRRVLLRTLGRCTGAFHSGLAVCEEGADPFLQRDWVRT